MKRFSITAFFILAAIFVYTGCESSGSVVEHKSLPVGATLENFKLMDTNGAEKSLNDLKGKNGAVIVFVSAQCPVVKQYNERIARFAADFTARGINVIGINSNQTEDREWIKSHAAEKYNFPVLIDKGNFLADKLGANVTPEIFYVNDKNVLVYHGAIDNNRSGEDISENYLRDAVEASLSGKPVTKTSVNAFGCSIKRV